MNGPGEVDSLYGDADGQEQDMIDADALGGVG